MGSPREPVRIEELLAQAGWLRGLVGSIVADRSTADDVAQETWVAALRHPPRGPASEQALRPWLGRIARNIVKNLHRGTQRRADREAARHGPSVPTLSPARIAEEAEAHRLLAEAVARLEESLRAVVVLRYFRGHDASEISRLLGVPPGTVRWRLMRALERLREDLDRVSGGERGRWLVALAPFATGREALAPAALSGPILFGGALVMKKLFLAVACLVCIGLIWRIWPARASSPGPDENASVPSAAVAVDRAGAPSDPESTTGDRIAVDLPATERGSTESVDPFGSLVVHVRWGDEGTDAAGIGLIVQPLDDPLGGRRVAQVRADEQGRARLERVHAGAVHIEADRGGALDVEVLTGKETEAVFDLPQGIDVEGTVTDPTGEPVGDAEVLLVAKERDWLATRVVARTNAAGWYHVRAAGEAFALSARAQEYTPANLYPLDRGGNGGRTVRADLVLAWYGHALRGIVLDPDHAPVAGALVAVGDKHGTYIFMQDGAGGTERFGMPVTVTAENGTFHASGIEQSDGMPVAVMAEGFPIAIAEVAGDLGSTAYCEVVLERAATLVGSVRDQGGIPVPGAVVRLHEQGDRLARDIPFPLPSTASNEDGGYRVELVAPGAVSVRIEPPGALDLGPVFVRLLLQPGETRTLDVSLPSDATIRGRAQDTQGRPLASLGIHWSSRGSARSRQPIETDADGRFEIAGCDEPPYTLDLVEPGSWKPLLSVRDVAPGPEDVLLVLPEPGSISGSFFDDGHRAPGPQPSTGNRLEDMRRRASSSADGIGIGISERSGERGWSAARDGNLFVFERIPPGTYRLTIRSDASIVHRSDWFELGPGEHLDLGAIRSEPAGSLAVEVSSAAEFTRVSSVIRTPDFDVAGFLRPSGMELVAEELSPGTWYVDIDADGMAGVLEPVEIRSGEVTRLEIRLEPGVDRTLAFAIEDGAPWHQLTVSVKGASDRLFTARRVSRSEGAAPSILVTLPAGTFEVEAATDTGLSARSTVVVTAPEPQDAPIVVPLR